MSFGRGILLLGLVLVAVGVLVIAIERFAPALRPGRLPGDIVYRGKNTVFYFPLATSIIVSVLLTLLLALFRRR